MRRLMPLSNPDGYISLAADEDTEIGILVNPSELAPESLKILQEELDKRYFTPTIQKIYRVKEQFGIHEWEVETERGRITFSVRGLNQNIKQVAPSTAFCDGRARESVRYSGLSGVRCTELSPNSAASVA